MLTFVLGTKTASYVSDKRIEYLIIVTDLKRQLTFMGSFFFWFV